RLAEALDHPFSLIWACLNLGRLEGLRGEFIRAIMPLERAVALSHEWNIAYLTPIALAALGQVYARSGRVEEGVSRRQQAVAGYASAGIGYLRSMSTVQLGEAHLLAGRVEEAWDFGNPCRGARPRARGTRSRGLGLPPRRRDGVTSRLRGRGGGRSPVRHLHDFCIGARHAPTRRSPPLRPRGAPRAGRPSAGGPTRSCR